MVKTQRNRRHNRTALRGAILLASLFWIGLGIYQWATPSQSTDFNYGGIACSQVQKAMADYQSRPMPSDLSGRVTVHLEHCQACRKHRDEMMSQGHPARRNLPVASLPAAGLPVAGRHRISCDCGHCSEHRPTLIVSR